MGLEDFEKELAAGKGNEERTHSHQHRKDEDADRKHHRHHHRSHRHRDDEKEGDHRRRHKRHREHGEGDERRRRKKQRSESPKPTALEEDVKVFDSDNNEDGEDDWVEKEVAPASISGGNLPEEQMKVRRDAWMQEPSALDIDYVASRKPKEPPSQFVSAKANQDFKVPEVEKSQLLADLQNDLDSDDEEQPTVQAVKDEPAQHEVSYTFGDSGSSWRMTKLKAVYRKAEESGRTVDDIAVERYGDLRDFDDAREEEREMDRRQMYGLEYVGLEKPSGELFQERKMEAGVRRAKEAEDKASTLDVPIQPQDEAFSETNAPTAGPVLDQTALNKLKAQLMKAKLRNAPNAAQLQKEYDQAASTSLNQQTDTDTVMLSSMDSRHLAGGRDGEVTAVSGKRGRERGLVVENEDMSIDDMVRHEKRTRGAQGGEGRAFAERIAKDGKFKNDLDYMDDNAANLSKKVMKSDVNLRNMAIEDYQKMKKTLESCPLCYHEDTNQPPIAPVVSLATRTYLTLPTEPEVAKSGAVIVPIQHRFNLLECDDDEWEEMRNFMKSLTRFYAAQDKGVIFYENAAHSTSRKGHAALNAIPLPHHLADNAPAYFKEAILASDEQWSQHKPIIDTLALSQQPRYGRLAFRKTMAKEMPYFHVFFSLDGGLGHVVEDERRWPKGDLFAREVIGGMLDRGPEVIKKQGRWERGDRRVEGFRKKWAKFDWTKVLMEAQ